MLLAEPQPQKFIKSVSGALRCGHHRRMSLPVLALCISVGSACFTLGNWLTSLATFRRGGPRLKVKATLGAHELVEAYRSGDKRRWRASWHVHVANTGAAAIQVEKVELVPWDTPVILTIFMMPARLLTKLLVKVVSRKWDVPNIPSELDWVKGEDKMRIEGYGGTRWVLNDRLGSYDSFQEVMLIFLIPFGMVQIRVTLTNGREVHSRPFGVTNVVYTHYLFHDSLSNQAEAEAEAEVKASVEGEESVEASGQSSG